MDGQSSALWLRFIQLVQRTVNDAKVWAIRNILSVNVVVDGGASRGSRGCFKLYDVFVRYLYENYLDLNGMK
jgi:hypothetical protein